MTRSTSWALPLLITASTAAQQWEVFDMAGAGFPSNRITALAEGPDNSLWVGTDWGLVHGHDGEWTVHQQGSSGLPENFVKCLAFDDQHRLWVGTVNAGIGIYDAGEWTILNTLNSPLEVDEVNQIVHDHLGRTWLATPAGLHVIQGGQWALYDNTPESHMGHELFGPNMSGTAIRADGLVGVYTRNAGLIYLEGEEMVYYTSYNSNFPDNSGNGLVFDPAGDRWLATAASGLVWHFGPYTEQAWMRFDSFTAGLPDNTMTSIVIGPNGRKYVGTEIAGLILFDGPAQWSVLDQANSGLPDDHVSGLILTEDGILWAGTNSGGLARYVVPLHAGELRPPTPFNVFPNPFSGHLYVRGAGTQGPLHWRLLDLSGAQVRGGEQASGAWTIDGEGLPAGIYLLEIRSGRERSIHRVAGY